MISGNLQCLTDELRRRISEVARYNIKKKKQIEEGM
jgi:hypothetical protein